MSKKPTIVKQSWRQFKATGMLWVANRILHLFGWAIVYVEDDGGKVTNVYPARVRFRGFPEKVEDKGFKAVSQFMKQNADALKEEADS